MAGGTTEELETEVAGLEAQTARLARGIGLVGAGPYRIPNLSIDVYAVYTNKAPAGALRGVIGRQACWAYEQEMDQIAQRLGMDAIELRLKNLLHDGDEMHAGETLEGFALQQCLERVRKALDWNSSTVTTDTGGQKVRAKGVACFVKHTMTPAQSFARLTLEEDGSLAVHVSSVEMGQGAVTALPHDSVGNAQLRTSAVTSSKIRNHSLMAVDFKAGQLPRGRRGETGLTGATGPTGPAGPQGPAATGAKRTTPKKKASPARVSVLLADPPRLVPGREQRIRLADNL